MVNVDTESDIERLREVAKLQGSQLERMFATLSKQSLELDRLRGKTDAELQLRLKELEAQIEHTKRAIYGRSSERRRPDELVETVPKAREDFGPTKQTEIEHIEELCTLDVADQTCPSCGGDLVVWEGQSEDSDLIDVIEAQYIVRKVKRQKYRCDCADCGHIETSDGPARLTPGGRYSTDFAIKVAADKYLCHLPLERQTRQMRRLGLKVTSQTLWDQLWQLQSYLEPTWEAIREEILKNDVIGLDQTTWKNLSRRKAKHWQIWCLTSPTMVYHTIRGNKTAETAADVLGPFAGTVVCDAMPSHKAASRDGPGFGLAYCWAHVRRKFFDAEKNFPDEAGPILDILRDMYLVERKAPLGSPELATLRAKESRLLVDTFFREIRSIDTLQSLDLGKAIAYADTREVELRRFLDNPKIWIDNNPTERALRGAVLGRKNHYGSKSQRGTIAAATFYSLMETAKLQNVNPTLWLREIVRQAQNDPHAVVLPSDL